MQTRLRQTAFSALLTMLLGCNALPSNDGGDSHQATEENDWQTGPHPDSAKVIYESPQPTQPGSKLACLAKDDTFYYDCSVINAELAHSDSVSDFEVTYDFTCSATTEDDMDVRLSTEVDQSVKESNRLRLGAAGKIAIRGRGRLTLIDADKAKTAVQMLHHDCKLLILNVTQSSAE